MHTKNVDRRTVIRTLSVLLSSGALGGCALAPPKPVCPNSPEVSLPCGPLTIDAHAHVFNGSDLPVNDFLTRVLSRQADDFAFAVKAVAPLLQFLAWNLAPSGDAEIRELKRLSAEFKQCSPTEHKARVDALANKGYALGKAQLIAAVRRSPEFQQLRAQLGVGVMDLRDKETAHRVGVLETIGQLEREDPKTTARDHRKQRGVALRGFTPEGVVDFLLQAFRYRYATVYDYLDTYNKEGGRVIDLVIPHMVDYDFWLSGGKHTHTTIPKQVEVMGEIAIVTGGRVHAFVPYDPLRRIAFDRKLTPYDPLELVKTAIQTGGCLGVKLYPPMGFAPYGNKHVIANTKDPLFWKQEGAPNWTVEPDFGERLDEAMDDLFSWCCEHDVPLMAHSGLSNGPGRRFEELAGSQYWEEALQKYKGLRITFGHFGDTNFPALEAVPHAAGFMHIMRTGPQALGRNAHADAAYFANGIRQSPELLGALQQLYRVSVEGQAPLSTRLMYGTDWEMLLVEGSFIDAYLGDFVSIFNKMEPELSQQGVTGLAERFFSGNAIEWLGLKKSEPARNRLEEFYALHEVATPDWMNKVDQAACVRPG